MRENVRVYRLDCIDQTTQYVLDELNTVRDKIRARAEDLFRERGGTEGNDVEDWLRAEREVSWAPRENVEESERALCFQFFDLPEDAIEVRVLPTMILLRRVGETQPGTRVLCRQIVLQSQIHAKSAVVRRDADLLTVSAAKLEPE